MLLIKKLIRSLVQLMKRHEIVFAGTSLVIGLILLFLAIIFYIYAEEYNLGWLIYYSHPLREYSLIVGGVGLVFALLGLFYRTSDGFFIMEVMRGNAEKRVQSCTACGKTNIQKRTEIIFP